MSTPPHIESAPGLHWRPHKDGWEARWRPRADLVKRGYSKMIYPLWAGAEPTETERAWISDQCNKMQTEMLVWGRGGVPAVVVFNGTLSALIGCYQSDADSGYHKLRYRTRSSYDSLTRRLDQDHGDTGLREIKGRELRHWHEAWAATGHIAMAHSLMGMLRTLFSFGATILEDEECERLCGLMSKLRFKMAKARNERLTAEQAVAVRAKAHEMGLHSIALAQAFQFECMLRQKDVIGEWVPQNEPGMSDVLAGGFKWLRGLQWSEIDQNLILRHVTSKRGKEIEVDLRLAPMVMEELSDGRRLLSGPVVVYELTDRPYETHQFRRVWRRVARAAGIPDSVYNMDSRAGAISEATDAGAELEHIRHAATHSDISMTQRYSRGSVEKAANVLRMRAAHRNKEGK